MIPEFETQLIDGHLCYRAASIQAWAWCCLNDPTAFALYQASSGHDPLAFRQVLEWLMSLPTAGLPGVPDYGHRSR